MVEGQGQYNIAAWLQESRARDNALDLTAHHQGAGNGKGEGVGGAYIADGVAEDQGSKVNKVSISSASSVSMGVGRYKS